MSAGSLSAPSVNRVQKAADVADLQVKKALQVAKMNNLQDEPALIAAIIQAIAANYAAEVTKPN